MADERVRQITFYGASDDLIEVGWGAEGEEYNVYPKGVTDDSMVFSVTTQVDDHIEGMRVRAVYDGVWSFAIGPLFFDDPDEPCPFPDWPVNFCQDEPAPRYSILLVIDAPPYTTVVRAAESED